MIGFLRAATEVKAERKQLGHVPGSFCLNTEPSKLSVKIIYSNLPPSYKWVNQTAAEG